MELEDNYRNAETELLEQCMEWTKCEGRLLQNGTLFTIEVKLKNGALSDAFLCITRNDGQFGLFPLNLTLRSFFCEGKICFEFKDMRRGHDYLLSFFVSDLRGLEILVSQIRICASISRTPSDSISEHNEAFLKENETNRSLNGKMKMYDVMETNSMVSPVIFSDKARETWEKRSADLNCAFLTTMTSVRMGLLTWNVASGKPTEEVCGAFEEVMQRGPDILFFAFQEIDMRLKSVVIGNSSMTADWSKFIERSVSESPHSYVMDRSLSLGGVYAAIAHKKQTKVPIVVSEPETYRLGGHGMTANKSGIMFTVRAGHYAKFTFIGCHLSANTEHLEDRVRELLYLVSKADRDTDLLILIGDLNFRITLTFEEAVNYIKTGKLAELIAADQLTQERIRSSAVRELQESPIMFWPTYKFDPGSDEYDTGPKHRVPSWTDRVLFKISPPRLAVGVATNIAFETDIVHHIAPRFPHFITESNFSMGEYTPKFPTYPYVELYDSMDSKFSDHRPVQCIMKCSLPIDIPEKVAEYEKMKTRKMDEMKLISRPYLSAPSALTIKPGKSETIKLDNVSLAWASWSAIVSDPSISVFPAKGITFPGIPSDVEIKCAKSTGPKMVSVIFQDNVGPLSETTVEIVEKTGFFHRSKK